MSYLKANKQSWDKWSKEGGPWSTRCSSQLIQKAKDGRVEIFITTEKLVPQNWFPKSWQGVKVLGIASGGGQQMPILAAAGAEVTSFDLSSEQLSRDQEVCQQESLPIQTVQGNANDLSLFDDSTFDMIINPVSSCFIKDMIPVWKEAYRVLKKDGILISGHTNPIAYALNYDLYDNEDRMVLTNSIPYSDLESLADEEYEKRVRGEDAFEFGHSLTQLIGGQLEAGFSMTHFYEDYWGAKFDETIDKILPQFIATRVIK